MKTVGFILIVMGGFSLFGFLIEPTFASSDMVVFLVMLVLIGIGMVVYARRTPPVITGQTSVGLQWLALLCIIWSSVGFVGVMVLISSLFTEKTNSVILPFLFFVAVFIVPGIFTYRYAKSKAQKAS